MAARLPLSVLDQSPTRQGGSASQALRETVALCQLAERFRYLQIWVAEHHNAASFTGTTPETLIGQIAVATSRIRVGSSGVMLLHSSASKVAETFRQLATFSPGRSDLGNGRTPGSDQRTTVALAYTRPLAVLNEAPSSVVDLLRFLAGRLPDGHPFTGITAQPGEPESLA